MINGHGFGNIFQKKRIEKIPVVGIKRRISADGRGISDGNGFAGRCIAMNFSLDKRLCDSNLQMSDAVSRDDVHPAILLKNQRQYLVRGDAKIGCCDKTIKIVSTGEGCVLVAKVLKYGILLV